MNIKVTATDIEGATTEDIFALTVVIKGTDANDTLTGGAGNDILDGGAGSDRLLGGIGNDTYIVDSIRDVVVENAGAGEDTVESAVNYTLTTNVEYLVLTGTANINGIGNNLDNLITGNSGDNQLKGLAGNDTLLGNAGNDTLIGGAGNDILTGKQGSDRFLFGNGDFETGDFSNWITTGQTTVEDFNFGVTSADGNYQAVLETLQDQTTVSASDIETFLELSSGSLTGSEAIEGSAMKQTIVAFAGDVVSFS